MSDEKSRAEHFLALHHQERPLLLANAWDPGSARLFAALGYQALATTSSGYAATLGRLDYGITREEALSHSRALAGAVEVAVSADLENCFAEDPAGVAETIRLAAATGLAGCSVEDWSPSGKRIYDIEQAVERVAAAAEAAHEGPVRLVLTARAENYLRERRDRDETIERLRRFEQAGADVLYAPAMDAREDIEALMQAVGKPVNVLARPGVPTVAELGALGVARVSVGGWFAFAALAAAADAARELLTQGTYDFTKLAVDGAKAARAAFG